MRHGPHSTSRGFVLWRLSDDGPATSHIVAIGRHPKPFTKADRSAHSGKRDAKPAILRKRPLVGEYNSQYLPDRHPASDTSMGAPRSEIVADEFGR
jgi:hypothetical protein